MVKNTKSSITSSTSEKLYPPVVAVLGHVDHGKTTLLDAIRKTNVVGREHGGITQRIGASTIEIIHEDKKRKITFLDTPGHEAFSKMRSRGSQAADIGLLIVSVADGVMPQTKESIQLLKETKIPFIVVLTKSDIPDVNPEKTKQQLLKESVLLEGLGGDVPYIAVSAKTGSKIKDLLELILLVFDLHVAPQKETQVFRAVVIESKLDGKVGPKATIVIKSGKVATKDEIFCEGIKGKVRMLTDGIGQRVQEATIGEAVEVLGFERVPPVGGIVSNILGISSEAATPLIPTPSLAPSFSFEQKPQDTISMIVIADTLGSLEAILGSLPEKAIVIEKKTGDIGTADVFLAKSVGAIIVGFNVGFSKEVQQLARTERVLIKNYKIIYELLSEINDVIEGKILALQEEIFGSAKILATFPFEKTKVLGVRVLDGRIAKGDKVRLARGDQIIGESTIVSVRQGKNSVSKVEKGQEAGIIISPLLDFTIGDVLICHG